MARIDPDEREWRDMTPDGMVGVPLCGDCRRTYDESTIVFQTDGEVVRVGCNCCGLFAHPAYTLLRALENWRALAKVEEKWWEDFYSGKDMQRYNDRASAD